MRSFLSIPRFLRLRFSHAFSEGLDVSSDISAPRRPPVRLPSDFKSNEPTKGRASERGHFARIPMQPELAAQKCFGCEIGARF